tara:strand:+ start:660 stop:794 length:135 start_codon:yes stop_codon:yes gene_type:complete
MFTLQEGHEMKQKNKRTKEEKKKNFTEVIVRKWTTDELMELGRS